MKVKTERYGGGERWHCPRCDVRQGAKLSIISWTNSTPPKNGHCPQCTRFSELHDDLVIRHGLTDRLVSVLTTRILLGVDSLDTLPPQVTQADYYRIRQLVEQN